ncbi:MAG: MFS transporter [Anaerolineae bacterium]|nr:MFS transporter [Anaerolineae bacterium]MDW8100595.1 MFS transporter [Anaerolineae bacterium]
MHFPETPAEHSHLSQSSWHAAIRALDHHLERCAEGPLSPERLSCLRYFWLDGLFSAISDNFYVNFITLFALAYGATNGQVGLLTAIGSLIGAVALFPGARTAEWLGKWKALVVWTGGWFNRLALLGFVCLPFLVTEPSLAIAAIIALNAWRAFMGNFANPAWTALVADLVPRGMRGRYFGSRNMAMGLAALVVAPVAGQLIKAFNGWQGLPFLGYQVVFGLAFLFGILGTLSFLQISEPSRPTLEIQKRQRGSLRQAIQTSPGFLGFVISAFIWNLALQIAAPFFNVYLVNQLHGTTSIVGLLAGVSSFFSLVGQRVFGRLLDIKGALWVQLITGLLIPGLPLAWLFVTNPWQPLLINAFGGLLWAGYNLSNFNLLLELTPDDQRPVAVALYQTVVFVSAVIGPLLGGYLADTVSYKLIFGLSGIGRVLGMAAFLGLTARAAIRYGKGLPARSAVTVRS